jgi:hypothetical protein
MGIGEDGNGIDEPEGGIAKVEMSQGEKLPDCCRATVDLTTDALSATPIHVPFVAGAPNPARTPSPGRVPKRVEN